MAGGRSEHANHAEGTALGTAWDGCWDGSDEQDFPVEPCLGRVGRPAGVSLGEKQSPNRRVRAGLCQ
jgi:hypothetical protein